MATKKLNLASKFTKRFDLLGQPRYEVTVKWTWQDGSSETTIWQMEEEALDTNDILMYMISYLNFAKTDPKEAEDWNWFEGECDASWILNECMPKTGKPEIPSAEVVKLEYVMGSTRVPVDIPAWNTLFIDEEDKAAKLRVAVNKWYD